jgi:hypothetical protein
MSRLPRPLSAPAVFGLGLLAAGCHDRATPTAPARVAAAPTIVERNDEFGAFYINDDDNKLAVVAGVTVPFATFCAEGGDFSEGRTQLVTPPPGGTKLQTFGAEVHVEVLQYDVSTVTDPCADLAGAQVVATGIAFARSNSSNFDGGGPGATANHFLVQGTVTLTGGGQARLQATAQVVSKPDGTFVVEMGRVRLTPL